jgi:SagB-type dehydrogenase family enzyme
MDAENKTDAVEDVIGYHHRTKHHLNRYARSAGYMDWENQPAPFRFYEGAEPEPLALMEEAPGRGRANLYQRRITPPAPLNRKNVAGFLQHALGLSAWKSTGAARWSLRINPSSGNLHPTEAHLMLPPEKDRPSGIFHYNPFLHALERRAQVPERLWTDVHRHLKTEVFLVLLTSIFWRESWKYGERAFRYCQHDAGHALAAAAFSAALFGWRTTVLGSMADDQVERMFGFDRVQWPEEEKEHPDLLFAVHPEDHPVAALDVPDAVVDGFAALPLAGRPNRLSRNPLRWDVIADVAAKTRKPAAPAATPRIESPDFWPDPGAQLAPASAIRRRRSALDFDPENTLSQEHFFAILDKTRPRSDTPPFDAGFLEANAHLLIFVHRIENLAPGLYLFLRDPAQGDLLRRSMRTDFLWEPTSSGFPLFLLERGDFRQTAMRLSCHQPIAGAGVFSLGMLVRFEERLADAAWRYRHLFMETGMIGQVLYLEAESRGVRGTGIGCYFDDAVHQLAGISGTAYQSLYHFTVGLPVEDPRLQTEPPYFHLNGVRSAGKSRRSP